ncbi:STAS-like domain-containing protein [Paenibacillus larvae]|uniref:STAS-like domain-containing protein n=1 Tax=Paenibacillus larvae TaxID=1464 RepID=UPI002281F2D3|nr:STAS-like domain-containing protein [Paenibacillus larvae]MCY9525856.1 STAS-like domain-containing protein [Paenibacillus larvae]
MGHVNTLDHVNHCYSNADGDVIRNIILDQFSSGQKVTISFKGVDSLSSSFINSAFIELLEMYDFDFIKTHLAFVNSSKSINENIKRRFSFEVKERKNPINVCNPQA